MKIVKSNKTIICSQKAFDVIYKNQGFVKYDESKSEKIIRKKADTKPSDNED
jgi:hypothetical protein